MCWSAGILPRPKQGGRNQFKRDAAFGRSAQKYETNTFYESNAEIYLGSGITDFGSDACRRYYCPLRSRRQCFYGIPLDEVLPQSISRSWHVQLAIFWIATSWLATGLYIAPAVSGYEPKYQVLGVNVLFGALLIVVFGSLAGQWLGVMQKLGYVDNFLWGHSGYEYVELGRIWQILLLVGLILWLILMVRALYPH
jgi:hypothetical protein